MAGLLRNRIHLCALAAASVWAWHPLVAGPILAIDHLVVPLLVFAVYQWNRTRDLAEDRINAPADATRAERSRVGLEVFSLLAFFSSLGLAAQVGEPVALPILAAGFAAGLLYSGTTARSPRLKTHASLKNWIPALVWGTIPVLYPVLHAGAPVGIPVAVALLYTACSALRVEIAWDWRDAAGDRSAGISTWANRMGEGDVIRRLHRVNGVAAALLLVSLASGWVSWLWAPIGVQCVGVALWIHRGRGTPDRRRWSHGVVAIDAVCAVAFGGFVRWVSSPAL